MNAYDTEQLNSRNTGRYTGVPDPTLAPQATPDQLLAKGNAMLAQTKAQGATPFAGYSPGPVNSSPNASSLTSPITPSGVYTPPPSSGAAGLLGEIEGYQEIQNAVDTAQKDKKEEVSETKKTLYDKVFGTKGKEGLKDEAYSETVDPAKLELNEINNQITAKQLAIRREIENIQDRPGLTKEESQPFANEIQRKGTRELADLSVIQMAKQGKYDSAKEIADRKIAVQFEKEQNEIDALKFWYEDAKEDLTKAEDRQYNLMISDRERKLDQQKADAKSITDLVIEGSKYNAPSPLLQQASKASTPREAAQILKGYLVDPLERQLKQSQIAKNYADIEASAGTGSAIADSIYTQLKTRSIEFNSLPADQKKIALKVFANKGEAIPRQLTAKEKQAADDATAGLDAIQQLRDLDAKGALPLTRSYIFGNTAAGRILGTSQFETLTAEATDVKTRIRTGAALNEQEIGFYSAQRPTFGDRPEDITKKFNQLEGFYLGMSGLPVTVVNPTTGESFEFNDLFDAKQRLGLRQAIQQGFTLNY